MHLNYDVLNCLFNETKYFKIMQTSPEVFIVTCFFQSSKRIQDLVRGHKEVQDE